MISGYIIAVILELNVLILTHLQLRSLLIERLIMYLCRVKNNENTSVSKIKIE